MAAGAPGPTEGRPGSPAALARRSRFLGQQYADVTKLRELGARCDHKAGRIHQRISRLNTRIERLRHRASVLREKGEAALATVPEVEQEVKQRTRDVERAHTGETPGLLRSDVTALQYRLRKTQQKVEDLRARSRALELRAAQRTQRASELKVKVDRLLESARLLEEEAGQFRQRADRLQAVTDQESGSPSPPPSSVPPSSP